MNTSSDIANMAPEDSIAKYRVSCGPGYSDGISIKTTALANGSTTSASRTYSIRPPPRSRRDGGAWKTEDGGTGCHSEQQRARKPYSRILAKESGGWRSGGSDGTENACR